MVRASAERGAALYATFLMLFMLAGLALAASTFARNGLTIGRTSLADTQALYLAEAGWQRARQALVAGTWTAAASPGNSYSEALGPGEYGVTIVDDGGGEYTVTSAGYVPTAAAAQSRAQLSMSGVTVTSSDGTNYSLTATASASSTSGANVAANAKDGVTTTKWQAGSNGNGWLRMDLGSATSLDKVVVEEDANITAVSIEYSDDASTWTAPSGLSVVESPSKTWTATFTATSHRYFRASVSAASSKKPAVKEMECYDSTLSALGQGEAARAW